MRHPYGTKPMKDKIININITTSTIIKTFLIIIVLWFLIFIRGILGVFLVALLLTAALKPMVDWLEKRKIPRGLGIGILYLIFFAVISLALILSIPPIIQQTKQLSENFPAYWDKIISGLGAFRDFSSQHGLLNNLHKIAASFENNLSNFAENIFGTISSIFGGVTSFIFILVIAFYMTMEKNAAERIAALLIPKAYQEKLMELLNKLEIKIGLWLRGQIILMIIIGLTAFVGLTILGINYSLILGIIAGLTEIVPYFGPVLGAIPAIFIAFTQSPYKALGVIVLYFIIQELENDIIVPKVMQKAVGLNPIVSIFALLIGAKIAGILGILLSIPVITSIIVIIKEFYPDFKLGKNKKI